MEKNKYFKENDYREAIYFDFLKEMPHGKTTYYKGIVTWLGKVKPLLYCSEYDVQITYNGKKPTCYVFLTPEIISRSMGREIPHYYPKISDLNRGKIAPCLYYPRTKEWTKKDKLCKTIVPWLLEWIYYFEIWLVTDVWHGSGIPHGGRIEDEK